MQLLKDSNHLLEKRGEEQQGLIKKLHEAQNQLLQSEKLASIGQLAAGVAHEINNPVGFINSNIGSLERYLKNLFVILDAYEKAEAQGTECAAVKTLKEQLDYAYLKEDVVSLIEETRDGVARVKKIVQDLKDFSHVDEAEWQWADLHKGLDSTLNVVNNEIKYKAEVVKEYGELPPVECLPSQLNQVFMNLLVNAAHAIAERGTITLRTGGVGEEVWVEVADTGSGIAPENMKRIFDPFFTTKPVGKGTGLGLSLSYGIVQKHHGRIEVQSEQGRGTTFRITLPVRQAEAAAA
ncbi:MAG: ATPase [Rhodocyclales bacterium GWA2_65_20]|nr:MAG: ATPase [Rhodocyclales bacterium GWA2_65_20]